MLTFQEIIEKLNAYWIRQGCVIQHGYDLEVGAGTFNPATFLYSIGPEPVKVAYVEPSRRPGDGRYGENPNRLQKYFQYQVLLKPSPPDIQNLYLDSIRALGFDLDSHDVRFVHDDWESPTLGAWGLGWEVWLDGMEITQFTYFQQVGGLELKPVSGELTYGLERIAMYIQNKDNVYDLQYNEKYTYGDFFKRGEYEFSVYNFEVSSADVYFRQFDDYYNECIKCLDKEIVLPAYDMVMRCSHIFNMLEARGVISITERTGYIGRIRDLARRVAEAYYKSRKELGFPWIKS